MSWKDQLRPGSFRGAPFKVDGHEHAGGRRLAVHAYPLRDRPYPEDLGRRPDRFEVEAFVLGADYMAARDRLVAACRARGPGRLVHPWLGVLNVAVEVYRVVETSRRGGMARIVMTMVEGGENVYPTSGANDAHLVGAAATAAVAAAVADLRRSFP